MSEILPPLSGVVELVAYSVIAFGIFRSGVKQSFAAFLLWGMLDIIATVTTMIEHGNYWLALSNAIGASLVCLLLVIKKQVSWSWVESLTALLVVVCLIIWATAGELAGLFASSIAVVIASVPQMVDTYKKPESTPTLAYIIFLIANMISLFAGKSWSIEERFYAACGLFLSIVILIFSLRKGFNLKLSS
ncbi:hypothetical protein BH09BAC3_BH09BAC3_26060 [soil metagenome]